MAVLADTHIRVRPDGTLSRWLPSTAEAHLAQADLVLHAGDVTDAAVLERLRTYAPLHAVLGNNDHALQRVLPPTVLVDVAGVRIAMVHDSGPMPGRAARMRRRFPDADLVVFGHSHAPINEEGQDGQVLFNPGSPLQRRAQPSHSMGTLLLDGGAVVERRVVWLD